MEVAESNEIEHTTDKASDKDNDLEAKEKPRKSDPELSVCKALAIQWCNFTPIKLLK